MAAINEPIDTHGKVAANLPLAAAEAGFTQVAFNRGLGTPARPLRVTAEGEARIAHTTRLMDCDFNGPAAGALLNNQWNQQATTLASALVGGFLRLNSGLVTTINTGISVNTWRTFFIRDHMNLKLSGIIKHENGNVQNKQTEFGFGYYDVAGGQAAPMNEFIGFRWTLTGGLLAVLEYSVGGAPTTVVEPINGGVPFGDNLALTYDLVVGEEGADFYVAGALVAHIDPQPGAAGVLKAGAYPVVIRQYHAGVAPALAPVFDIGGVAVSSIGPSADEDRSVLQVAMGRHALRAQAGVQSANGNLNNVPASATAPTALAATNAVSGLVGLGGYGRITVSMNTTPHTEFIMCSFQNPLVPELAGAANNARSLIITDIMISPLLAAAALTGGGFVAEWFVAFGGTALSLATADAIGGAAPGTKSFTKMPLPIIDSMPAAAAIGTIATRSGVGGHIPLQTPLVIAPGEFIELGIRTLYVAATAAGQVDGGYGFNGYWN